MPIWKRSDGGHSRRTVLLAAGAGMASLAGCAGGDGESNSPTIGPSSTGGGPATSTTAGDGESSATAGTADVPPKDLGRWMNRGFYFVRDFAGVVDRLETLGMDQARNGVDIASGSTIFERGDLAGYVASVNRGVVTGQWSAEALVDRYVQNRYRASQEGVDGFDVLEKDGEFVLVADGRVVSIDGVERSDLATIVEGAGSANLFVTHNPGAKPLLEAMQASFGSVLNPARYDSSRSPPAGVAQVCGREYDLSGETPTVRSMYLKEASATAEDVRTYAASVSPWMQGAEPIDAVDSGPVYTFEYELDQELLLHDISVVTVS